MTNENLTFSNAYNGLKETVEKLRNSKDEDIDTLFQCVEDALNYRKVCIARLNVIKEMMKDKNIKDGEI